MSDTTTELPIIQQPAAAPATAATVAAVQAKPRFPADWVNVRLSEAGIAFAGKGGQVHVANGRMAYTFLGTEPQRVLVKGEAPGLLAELVNGKPIFELSTN